MTTPRSAAADCHPGFIGALTLTLGLVALFLYVHPYRGIRHDAELYALIALRPLYDAALSGDLFFSHGSQASYTLFPWLQTLLVQHWGLDTPAWLLTRLGSLAFFASAFLLARRLAGPVLAWLATALLVLLPAKYGAGYVFGYAEDFATPRVWAEALVLGAFAMRLAGRTPVALAMLLLAMAVHPLVAAAGVLCMAVLTLDARTQLRLLLLGAVLGGVVLLVAFLAPMGPLRLMDPAWLAALRKMIPYLLTDQWSLLDWQRVAVPLATLAVGLLALPKVPARDLARSALLVAAAGTALAVMASLVAPVVILIQGQPWRWLWLARAIAVLLLAPIAQALWGRGLAGRATLALVATSWLGAEDALGLEAALCALLAAFATFRTQRAPRHWPWVALALALAFTVGILNLVALDGPLPLALVATVFVVAVDRFESRLAQAALAVATAALLGQQVAARLETPIAVPYDELAALYAPWSAAIPETASVLATSNSAIPGLALHRRSYVGNIGAVFSRDSALLELARSQQLVDVIGHTADWFGPRAGGPGRDGPTLETLRRLCSLPELDFVLVPTPLPAPRRAAAHGLEDPLYLYACRDLPRPAT